MGKSLKQRLKELPKDERQRYISQLTNEEAHALINSWLFTARPEQLPPDGTWFIWLMMMGRGAGKTRAAAEFVVDQIMNHGARDVALVGRTAGDVRRVMVRAILEVAELRGLEAYHESSKTLITFGNGAIATTYSAEAGDQLRGPQHDLAWADEIGAWPKGKEDDDAWNNLLATVRKGNPKVVASTTPRRTSLIKQLVEDANDPEKGVVITVGTTYDNADNLAPSWLDNIKRRFHGTRIGQQELEGKLLLEVEGALFRYDDINTARIDEDKQPAYQRVVVGVDPATTTESTSDYTGITVAALGFNDEVYVLHSEQVKLSPNGWANRVLTLVDEYNADRIIAERNNGGQMVESTIRTARRNAPVTTIHASRGKQTRAEPVAALMEQGRVHHVGTLEELEDQLTTFPVASDHDDLVDSYVYAITELAHLHANSDSEMFSFAGYRRKRGGR